MKLSFKLLSISFLILFLTACTNSTQAVNNTIQIDKKPEYQIPKRVEQPQSHAKGSLYANQGNSLFTDRKNLQLGDIVYVLINEVTQGTTEGTKKKRVTETGSTKIQNVNENTKNVTPLSVTPNEESPGLLQNIIKGINGILGIGLSVGDSTSTFDTDSSSTAVDELVNDIAVVVTQEYQNGNYFIEGQKDVSVRGQKITIKLSGVMNPNDLNTKSEISSNRIANLKVMLYKNGTESDNEEKHWGNKIIDTISPF